MQEASTKNNIHLIYGILFTAIALVALIALVVVRSRADNSNQNVSISAVAPTVTVYTSTSNASYTADDATITIAENSTQTVYVHGTATDLNGCTQTDPPTAGVTWTGKVYRTNSSSGNVGTGAACTSADPNDCYTLTEADLATANCSTTTRDYRFTFTASYYWDPTDASSPTPSDYWTSRVDITDSDGLSVTSTSETFEVGTQLALNVGTAIAYGTRIAGSSPLNASDILLEEINTGNIVQDINLYGSGNMTCTGANSQTFTVGQAKYALDAAQNYTSSMTALTATNVAVDISTPQRTANSTTGSTVLTEGEKTIYWKLTVPYGVSGECTNTVTVSAKTNA